MRKKKEKVPQLPACPNCTAQDCKTVNVIKGSSTTRRVDRNTCNVCGVEWTSESKFNESQLDEQEYQIREGLKQEKNLKEDTLE